MATTVKITRIGNSQGIRLPKKLLERYRIKDRLLIEETADSIILKPLLEEHLSWKDTYREMAESGEDWSDWEAVAEDGLDDGD